MIQQAPLDGTLYFAGEHTCDNQTPVKENKGKPVPSGHMTGALYSGYRVAQDILTKLGKSTQ